jgi:hypothetical protein
VEMGYCTEINLTFLGMGYILLGFGLVREYWDSILREERIINIKSVHQNFLYGICNL